VKLELRELSQTKDEQTGSPVFTTEIFLEGIEGCKGTGFSKKESHQQASKETLQRLRREPQFIDAIFAAKADRTKMEEEPVMAAPDIDKLQEEQQNFIIEQEKLVESVLQPEGRSGACNLQAEGRSVARNAVPQRQTKKEDDDFSLDDITTTPREKTREEIIAEAEAAAFADE
jgi:ribonuclease-3